jgi:global nitrogen regulator NtcA
MVATTDIPLAAVFHQGGNSCSSPVVEMFEQGETIFFPGEPAQRVYFILEGVVKLSSIYESGEETTVALLSENRLFGVLSLLTGHHYAERFYHAVALTPVQLLSAPIAQLEQGLKHNPELSVLMLQELAFRILHTQKMIETLAYGDMSCRLFNFLVILCQDFGFSSAEGMTIELKLSHQAMADAIGTTRVSVTRLLSDLQQEKRITICKKRITVHNPINLS